MREIAFQTEGRIYAKFRSFPLIRKYSKHSHMAGERGIWRQREKSLCKKARGADWIRTGFARPGKEFGFYTEDNVEPQKVFKEYCQ